MIRILTGDCREVLKTFPDESFDCVVTDPPYGETSLRRRRDARSGEPHMTPSQFHDQAYRRDAGHDRLQADFLTFLRSRPFAGIPEGAIVHRTVEAEFPLRRRGEIVAYVDAVEILTVNLSTTASLFEVKPRIHTVFGIVRQAKAYEALAQGCIPADMHFCHVIVPAADPLLAALKSEWPRVWAWEKLI
jgi:hypothetical protein